ncbi:MAG TPA: DUF4389 domain-containing protein [Enteractinococcus sp.]
MDANPTHPTYSAPAQPPRMRPWNWVLLVVGVLLTALGLGLVIGGAIIAGAEAAQRDGQYLTLETERYQSTGYAIITPRLIVDPGTTASTDSIQLEDVASFQVRVTPVIPDQEIFVGIADASDVATYLDDVPHAVLEEEMTWGPKGQPPDDWSWEKDTDDSLQEVAGTQTPAAPAEQDFWAASTSGTDTQELTFDLQEGQWTMVAMSADGSRPVWIDLQAGARTELLDPISPGLWIAGLVGLVIGIPLLLLGAAGLGRDITPAGPPARNFGQTVYPLAFVGQLDGRLSRWLWLFKWLLAIPHYIVLALLGFALMITTIAAGIVILFTGRYPRSWFAFVVGVLRWNWRVGFYSYAALGTDRYPPFTLALTDYPAELTVPYPERLSHGLVLAKWWLLAIPHLLIVAILTGGAVLGIGATDTITGWGLSLLALLVLIAAIALLFTGRYLPGLFALVIGLNRWTYRVSTYVLLLRDEYPPFRLEQGPTDPPQHSPPEASSPILP